MSSLGLGLGLKLGFPGEGGSAPSAPLTVVNRNEVQFDPGGAEPSKTWPIPEVTPGNTLVVAFIPTLGESIPTCTDNLDNVYVHDRDAGKGHVFRLNNCPNNPTSITVTVDTFIDCRLYTWELSNCPDGLELLEGAEADYTSQTGRNFPFETVDSDCFSVALVGCSPSRTPVVEEGTTLSRLLMQGGEPYTGPVSEHALDKIFPDPGSVSLGSTWTAEGACNGTQSYVLYRKVP